MNQLINIYNTFCKSLDEGKEVHAVFCHMSRAFDKVWYKGFSLNFSLHVLIFLIPYYGSRITCMQLRVVLPGAATTWKSIKADMPLGSILCFVSILTILL